MPLVVSWPLEVVEAVLAKVGVYLIEKFPDGQTRWGTEPYKEPYTGAFTMACEYAPRPGCYDIFQLRAVLHRLNKEDRLDEFDALIFASSGDRPDESHPGNGRIQPKLT